MLDDNGEGEDAWIIKALDHIAEQNANSAGMSIHGLNLSLGGPYDSAAAPMTSSESSSTHAPASAATATTRAAVSPP